MTSHPDPVAPERSSCLIGVATAQPASIRISSFEEDSVRLDVRDAVAVVRFAEGEQKLFYLSLFDDEIEARFEEFIAIHRGAIWTEFVLGAAALRLEPTDTVVIFCLQGDVLVARGGAANFPLYWSATAGSILLSTTLPLDQDRRISRAGLMTSIAAVSVSLQNEPNLSLLTPSSQWSRCRRGAVSKLSPDAGCVFECPIDLRSTVCSQHGRDHLIEAIRSALDKFGSRLRGRPKALVELSGGFDSTFAAVAARKHGIGLLGVSLHFPYYEFRFEEDIQHAVAEALPVCRTRLDGTALLPYAPPAWWPRLDEPATGVIALARNLAIAELASRKGVDRILVGYGGDHLFSENLLEPVTGPNPLARGALSSAGWIACKYMLNAMRTASTFLQRSTLTYLDDRRMDLPLKEAFGTITRSPFTDLKMVQCGLSWTSLAARSELRLGKSILADSFVAELPSAVTGRRGKVCWDGVCARAYSLHGDAIANEIELVKEPLKHIGLDVQWLVRRVGQLARWEKTKFGSDDKEVIAAYALATWLHSWGVERVTDCSWSD